MSRYFNKQEVELLAPAGNFEIFKDVINSGADAVYLGGKVLNMRMHRKDFNFTNEEIVEAVKIAHSLNKKVYITVNNLISNEEIAIAKDYLKFLEGVAPDALIVQDMAILELIREMDLKLNIHSSVMMNVHNLETVKALKKLGVTRVVTSREIDLQTIKLWYAETGMEFEYFTHGDMCVAHGSQCLYSGMIFGKSSNRGLCMKPCRWKYSMNKDGKEYQTTYPMAVKDMYMYENIPELIEAGVVSFKIEGRMRDSEYLIKLVNFYSDAIDRYIEDPINYDRRKDSDTLYESRKRDLSTGYAFGTPGLSNINERYEGTGKFYSTGKVFSNPIEEIEMKDTRIEELKEALKDEAKNNKPKLSVKVNSYEAAKLCIEEGVDNIYLSGEVFEPNKPFSKEEIKNLCKVKGNSNIILALPRMMFEKDFSQYHHLLSTNNFGLDAIAVTNLGSIEAFKDLKINMIGDYALNIYNSISANFYRNRGVLGGTLSVEAPLNNTKEAVKNSNLPLEVIVHGSPVVMYMSHDLYKNLEVVEATAEQKVNYAHNSTLILKDDKGNEHPVYRDSRGLNHMLLSKDLCYLPILKELNNLGVNSFRIEGCHYSLETLKKVIEVYKEAINDLDKCESLIQKLDYKNSGFTLGALQFN